MQNIIKYYEEIPLDELTEELLEYGIEFEDNQFIEKLEERIKNENVCSDDV